MKKNLIPANIIMYMGLIAIAFGISAITVPDFTIKTIIIIVGIIISMGGLATLIIRLRIKTEKKHIKILHIFGSSLNIAFGLVLAIIPSTFLEIFIIILGAAIILGGIGQLVLSLSFTPLSTTSKVFLGLSLLMIIAGTIMAINPFEAIEAITMFFGIIITIFGLVNVIMSFWYRSEIALLSKLDAQVLDINIEEATVETENPEDKF